jgi:formiminoglutamase
MACQDYYKLSNYDWLGRLDEGPGQRLYQYVQCLDVMKIASQEISSSIGFLGFKCDEGVLNNQGRVGAALGPDALRQELAKLAVHTKLNSGLWDLGDIICHPKKLSIAQEHLANTIKDLRSQNIMPIIMGGGHETAWGHYLGIKQQYANQHLAIVNFDAHFDLRELGPDGQASSGTPFLQIAQDHIADSKRFDYTCIGIQKSANTNGLFSKAEELKANYVLAEDIHLNGLTQSLRILDAVINNADVIYVSLCLDVFSITVAPGVSAPQVLGLEPFQVLPLLRHLLSSKKVVAFDIVELAPQYDRDHRTAKLAANLVLEVINNL